MTDNDSSSIGDILHQGKSIADWEKILKKDYGFSQKQILAMARSGTDLEKISLLGLDESMKAAKKAEEKAEEKAEDKDASKAKDAVNEAVYDPEDVVTVKDFIEIIRRRSDLDDKLQFRSNKKPAALFDVTSKAGITIVDVIDAKSQILESGEEDDGKIESVSDLIDRLNDVTTSPSSTNIIVQDENGNNLSIDSITLDRKGINVVISTTRGPLAEGHGWYRGGYGGTGKSYSRLGDKAPRGAQIGWFAVEQLDPRAKGKMDGWRMGPTNFPFEDLLYPERKYKIGTTAMRNKYVKAGAMSGEKYISIPSYFDAIKNNDEEAINILKLLGIPLDLTFGLNPNDDYSMTYRIQQ